MTDFSGLMSSLFSLLLDWTNAAMTWLYNLFIDFFQSFLDIFFSFAVSIVSLFPAGAPLPSLGASPTTVAFSSFINALNWFFPIGYLVSVVTFLVTAMLAYFFIAPLARWFKLLT